MAPWSVRGRLTLFYSWEAHTNSFIILRAYSITKFEVMSFFFCIMHLYFVLCVQDLIMEDNSVSPLKMSLDLLALLKKIRQ